MKPNLHINIAIIALLLSVSISAQIKDQNLSYTSFDNNYKQINSIKEKIVVISIFDPDNSNELKKMNELARIYKNSNISFISVSDNLNSNLDKSLKKQILHYQHLSKDENERVFNKYQTGMYKVFPMHIILNKEGEVTYKKKGKRKNIEGKMAKRIDRLLDAYLIAVKSQELKYTSR